MTYVFVVLIKLNDFITYNNEYHRYIMFDHREENAL